MPVTYFEKHHKNEMDGSIEVWMDKQREEWRDPRRKEWMEQGRERGKAG